MPASVTSLSRPLRVIPDSIWPSCPSRWERRLPAGSWAKRSAYQRTRSRWERRLPAGSWVQPTHGRWGTSSPRPLPAGSRRSQRDLPRFDPLFPPLGGRDPRKNAGRPGPRKNAWHQNPGQHYRWDHHPDPAAVGVCSHSSNARIEPGKDHQCDGGRPAQGSFSESGRGPGSTSLASPALGPGTVAPGARRSSPKLSATLRVASSTSTPDGTTEDRPAQPRNQRPGFVRSLIWV